MLQSYRVCQKIRTLFEAYMSKTTLHDGKFETHLERKKLGNYLNTKFSVTAFCKVNLHVKKLYLQNRIIIQSSKIYFNINVSIKGQVF